MTTADAFYCTKCKGLVRGVNGAASPGPDGTTFFKAECVVCKATVHKVVYPNEAADGQLAPKAELAHDSRRNLGGIPERPSMLLWASFIKALSEILPEDMRANTPRTASLLWYNYMTYDQKKAAIQEFEATGKVTIPLEQLRFGRTNPQLDTRVNPSPLTPEAKNLLEKVVEAFWGGSLVEAIVEGWKVETLPIYRNIGSGELKQLSLTADGIEVANFYPVYPDEDYDRPEKRTKEPSSFILSIFDAGLYSHEGFKTPVLGSSFVVAGLLILLFKGAPIKNLGEVKYEKGILRFTGKGGWSTPSVLDIRIRSKDIPLELRKRFWVLFDVYGKKETIAPTEIGELVELIDAKERMFAQHIEKLYLEDPDLAKQAQLDLVKVARLMGDTEYEHLLERRDRLFWEEEKALAKPASEKGQS